MKIYFVQDNKGKIWKETCSYEKHFCKQKFARDFLSLLDFLDMSMALDFWRLFERNGWQIVELELKLNDELLQQLNK